MPGAARQADPRRCQGEGRGGWPPGWHRAAWAQAAKQSRAPGAGVLAGQGGLAAAGVGHRLTARSLQCRRGCANRSLEWGN